MQRLKAWLPVSSHPTNIVQRNAFRSHSTNISASKFSRYTVYTDTCIMYMLATVVLKMSQIIRKFDTCGTLRSGKDYDVIQNMYIPVYIFAI